MLHTIFVVLLALVVVFLIGLLFGFGVWLGHGQWQAKADAKLAELNRADRNQHDI